MPGLDGAELVQQIKAVSPETPASSFSGKIRMSTKIFRPICSCQRYARAFELARSHSVIAGEKARTKESSSVSASRGARGSCARSGRGP